jgi:hypothetical protein
VRSPQLVRLYVAEAPAELGRADDIGEQDRHDAPAAHETRV